LVRTPSAAAHWTRNITPEREALGPSRRDPRARSRGLKLDPTGGRSTRGKIGLGWRKKKKKKKKKQAEISPAAGRERTGPPGDSQTEESFYIIGGDN